MRQVNIHEAKTHFSELIAAVERGEEIVIARRGKIVAKLGSPNAASAVSHQHKPRFGLWKGKMKVSPSFFEPLTDEELAEWLSPIEGLEHSLDSSAHRRPA